MSKESFDISLVIPVLNEAHSIRELTEQCVQVLNEKKWKYEILFLDDGSQDNSWIEIEKCAEKYSVVRGVRMLRNYGKSAMLNIGFKAVLGKVVFTLDGDLQDDPSEIPAMYNQLISENLDIVSGWKKQRYDHMLTKNIPSKLFNLTTRFLSRIKLHDFNCGLKAYRIEVVKNIELYSDMHRYLPVLAKWKGFSKIGEKVVKHRPRKYGVSKFGINRFWNGIIDLILIMFMGKFGKRPIQLFGFFGIGFIFSGLAILLYLTIGKFIFLEYEMTQRPIFYLGIVLIILGFQIFMTGFVAELILRNASETDKPTIREMTHNMK